MDGVNGKGSATQLGGVQSNTNEEVFHPTSRSSDLTVRLVDRETQQLQNILKQVFGSEGTSSHKSGFQGRNMETQVLYAAIQKFNNANKGNDEQLKKATQEFLLNLPISLISPVIAEKVRNTFAEPESASPETLEQIPLRQLDEAAQKFIEGKLNQLWEENKELAILLGTAAATAATQFPNELSFETAVSENLEIGGNVGWDAGLSNLQGAVTGTLQSGRTTVSGTLLLTPPAGGGLNVQTGLGPFNFSHKETSWGVSKSNVGAEFKLNKNDTFRMRLNANHSQGFQSANVEYQRSNNFDFGAWAEKVLGTRDQKTVGASLEVVDDNNINLRMTIEHTQGDLRNETSGEIKVKGKL